MTTRIVHPFEAAGLGLAPFKCIGHSVAKYQAAPGSPIQPGSSCDYCGTAIMDVYQVRSANGREFKVGSDCIRHTCTLVDGKLPLSFRLEIAAMDREKREERRAAEFARLTVRIAKARAILAGDATLFTSEPHPVPYFHLQGKTLRDSVEWSLANAGMSGRTATCRLIERRVKTMEAVA